MLSEQLQPSPGTDEEREGLHLQAAQHRTSRTGTAGPQLPRGRPDHPRWWSTGVWWRPSVINRAWVRFYLMWVGRSRPLPPALAHTLHPTASSCIVVSTDEGLKDGQILYVLFSEKANKLPAQNLYKKKKKNLSRPRLNTHTQCSEEQMKFPAFIRSKSLSLSELKLHKFIHMVKMPLKRDKFSQKGPKQTGPSPLK